MESFVPGYETSYPVMKLLLFYKFGMKWEQNVTPWYGTSFPGAKKFRRN
jgi:hypothetical protein